MMTGMLLTQTLGYSSTCLFVCISLSSSIRLILQSCHGDNLWNTKFDLIWFLNSRESEEKVKSTAGSHNVKYQNSKENKYKPGVFVL